MRKIIILTLTLFSLSSYADTLMCFTTKKSGEQTKAKKCTKPKPKIIIKKVIKVVKVPVKPKIKRNTLMLRIGTGLSVGGYTTTVTNTTSSSFKEGHHHHDDGDDDNSGGYYHHGTHNHSSNITNTQTIYKEKKLKTVPVIGISYSRRIGDSFRLGGSLLSNETYTLDIGFDF